MVDGPHRGDGEDILCSEVVLMEGTIRRDMDMGAFNELMKVGVLATTAMV